MEQENVRNEFGFYIFIDCLSRGINILNNKSELQKAMEKHRKLSNKNMEENMLEKGCSEFDKMLTERARILLKVVFVAK